MIDGTYKIDNEYREIVIKDNKLMQCSLRLKDRVLAHVIWYFEYGDSMNIYREFPSNGKGKELFCDINGRTDNVLIETEKFNKTYDLMLTSALNESMQLEDKVESCCMDEGSILVKCKDDTIIKIN
jgi:hypothetical protein